MGTAKNTGLKMTFMARQVPSSREFPQRRAGNSTAENLE